MSTATFAAGCFWGVEAAFRRVEGVTSTEVGYTGGQAAEPTYQQVCTGRTGHAEAVRVGFDPARVSYDDLLAVFWACHDPTQLDRQGPDVGTQYRSAIFFHDAAQEEAATRSRDALAASGAHADTVVTEIVPAVEFWRAEEYHQQYLAKRGQDACATTIRRNLSG
jgi:peptide-methionine (S)-S-oxide reductase